MHSPTVHGHSWPILDLHRSCLYLFIPCRAAVRAAHRLPDWLYLEHCSILWRLCCKLRCFQTTTVSIWCSWRLVKMHCLLILPCNWVLLLLLLLRAPLCKTRLKADGRELPRPAAGSSTPCGIGSVKLYESKWGFGL